MTKVAGFTYGCNYLPAEQDRIKTEYFHTFTHVPNKIKVAHIDSARTFHRNFQVGHSNMILLELSNNYFSTLVNISFGVLNKSI